MAISYWNLREYRYDHQRELFTKQTNKVSLWWFFASTDRLIFFLYSSWENCNVLEHLKSKNEVENLFFLLETKRIE